MDQIICNGGTGINIVPSKPTGVGFCMLSSTKFILVLMHIVIALGSILDSKCDNPLIEGTININTTVCATELIHCDTSRAING